MFLMPQTNGDTERERERTFLSTKLQNFMSIELVEGFYFVEFHFHLLYTTNIIIE